MRNQVIYIADFIIILLCITGIYQVYEKAGLPIIFEHNSLLIEELKNKNIPLKINDGLISIDGVKLSTHEELEFLLDSKAIGQIVSISIVRNGSPKQERVVLESYYTIRYIVIQVLVTSVFIFIAVFVYVKRKEDNVALVFNLVLIAAALIIASTWGRYTIEPKWIGQLTRMGFSTAYAFAAVLFFQFTLLFPNKKNVVPNYVVKILYLIGFILSIFMSYLFINASNNNSLIWFNSYNSVFNYTRIFFTACCVLSLINIAHTYAILKDESERRKMRWILLGVFIGPLTLIVLWIIPQIITSRGAVDEEYILLSMLAVPIAFAISIVKYHILNIDQVFKRGTVYLLVFSTVLLIYSLIVWYASILIGTLTVSTSLLVSSIAAIVIAALFSPIKGKVQSFVDVKLFKVSYNYREAEFEFIEKLKFCYDDDSLCSITIESIQKLIPNDDTKILLFKNEKDEYASKQYYSFSNDNIPKAISEHIEYGAMFNKVTKDFFPSGNSVLGVRIFSEINGLLGIIFLGEKKSGFRYNLEDIDLIKVFCYQDALALERIRLQNKLITEQIEKTRLKELNELKSYFVSSVSHELKTPLTSIKMFTELIEESKNTNIEKRNEYLKIIRGESSRLSRLIDNVLDISKIEKGIKEYHKTIIELNDCINDAIKTMEYQLDLNGFDLQLEITNEESTIYADYDAIVEVIINLISNSIKYSKVQKKIKVLSVRHNSSIVLSVEDQGLGIPESDLDKIFQPFERVNRESKKSTAGTGLGLAIVKHIVDAHDSKLEVISEVDKGSKFSIAFPIYNGG